MAKIRVGYMCGTDYDHHLAGADDDGGGQSGASRPVEIYSDRSLLESARPCVKDAHNPCPVLRVEIKILEQLL